MAKTHILFSLQQSTLKQLLFQWGWLVGPTQSLQFKRTFRETGLLSRCSTILLLIQCPTNQFLNKKKEDNHSHIPFWFTHSGPVIVAIFFQKLLESCASNTGIFSLRAWISCGSTHPLSLHILSVSFVLPIGFKPMTLSLEVRCSIRWAKGANIRLLWVNY